MSDENTRKHFVIAYQTDDGRMDEITLRNEDQALQLSELKRLCLSKKVILIFEMVVSDLPDGSVDDFRVVSYENKTNDYLDWIKGETVNSL